MKRWKISTPDSEAVEVICKRTELSQLCAEIMTSRGVTQIDDLAEFFNSSELSDPFELKDMDKAVEAINNTLEGFGLICVYGDYDCDGVTATVVLYNYLECIGANVMYYIPERELKDIGDVDVIYYSSSRRDLIQVDNVLHADCFDPFFAD